MFGKSSTFIVFNLFLFADAVLAVDFNRDVAPILQRRCVECHFATGGAAELSLTSAEGIRTGGKSGAAIQPGKANDSLLIQRIVAGEMPPEKSGSRRSLTPTEIRILQDWIQDGAAWPAGRVLDPFELSSDSRAGRDWWSFQPIQRPKPPSSGIAGANNLIDDFIGSQLSKRGWQPAPPADRPTLVRRVYYDLHGLPPTAEESQAFVRDTSPSAYEDLVDRLISSPRFGERWSRYWLDVVRFAETCGYERDQEKPHAWRYRDWVLSAFNNDMPLDRFILEQLAGDELADRTEQSVIATGFLRLGTWNDEPNDPHEYKYERLEDMVHATSVAFLGLTTKCARCHDHKFDPISQVDYYRMATAFWAGYIEPGSRDLQGGPNASQLGFDVLGWTDSTPNPTPLRLLKKGDPLRPAEVITPAHLSIFPQLNRSFVAASAETKTTLRRKQLAEWIADRDNPLTARVWVNRLWQHHFGQPIVATPDNFGFAAGTPLHDALLDWLASELIASNWSSKHIHRLILTSRTYQQSVLHPRQTEIQQDDPQNAYFWRASRRRLEAESIRDSLLMASGNLDLRRIGGSSFRMDIDSGALEGLSMKGNAWKASPQNEQNRRALYSFSKRGLLPPLLTSFDFADTTLPCGKRDVTTVAPQALALLNNSFVHHQSEQLGRVLHRYPVEQQIIEAWKRILGREPAQAEVQLAKEHLADQTKALRAAQSTTARPPGNPFPPGLTFYVSADRGLQLDARQGVVTWHDQSSEKHDARQPVVTLRPKLAAFAWNGRPVIRFDGTQSQLKIDGQVLPSQQFTLVAVVADRGTEGLREIFSNWNGGAQNSTTSVFLGLKGKASVRFSDDFAPANELDQRETPFVLTAVSGSGFVAVYQNQSLVGRRESSLAARNLSTNYVIGTQGNLNSEYWAGEVGAILAFDRALSDEERTSLVRQLQGQFGIATEPPVSVEERALASLCHVLLNSNEFLYID